MNLQNTARLFERFDYLYRGRHLPDTQNLMCYGFQCGDGWFDLIYKLSVQLDAYRQLQPEAAELIVIQVKQKFGALRVYVHPVSPAVQQLIEQASDKSRQTCERSGQPGVMCRDQNDFYQTLCPALAAQFGFEPVKPKPDSETKGLPQQQSNIQDD